MGHIEKQSLETGQRQELSDAFLKELRADIPKGYNLYMIIDGAQDERIAQTLLASGQMANSLYAERVDSGLKAVGPWLIPLFEKDWLSSWCINEGLDKNWFILFASKGQSLTELGRHFRRFAIVQDESGQHLYFRYYDPRIFEMYLPSCNTVETKYVFGEIACFWTYVNHELKLFRSDTT